MGAGGTLSFTLVPDTMAGGSTDTMRNLVTQPGLALPQASKGKNRT